MLANADYQLIYGHLSLKDQEMASIEFYKKGFELSIGVMQQFFQSI